MIESLESRTYFATTWSSYAQLVDQDVAASTYSSISGKGVAVAVIDTGVDYDQPALGGGFGKGYKVEAGYDFADNDSDPMDQDGHGTGVASVIAANKYTVNGVTYQGIAPNANIVALRVGTEDSISDANIAKALQWVIKYYKTYNIKVVNLSLGSGSYTDSETESDMSSLFETLRKDGIFVTAASGNSNDQQTGPISQDGVAYPSADPNVFSVGAVDSTDTITTWSQRGDELDLLAPGVQIELVKMGGGYTAEDGTSFSSPMVAGTAALLMSYDTTATPGDVGSIMMSSGASNRDGDTETGNTTGLLFSRLNIANAIKLARTRLGSTNTLAASSVIDTAVDSQGTVYAAYYDAKNGNLDFATRDGTGKWSKPTVIDSGGDVGAQLSIAVDSDGKPAIAYYDTTNSALKYAQWSGTGWSIKTVESSGFVGLSPSLAFAIDGNAYVAYYRKTGGLLRLGSLDRDANTWSVQTIDGSASDNVGADVSLAVGEAATSGNGMFTTYDTTVAVAYSDVTNGNLKYARLDVDNSSATWFIGTAADTNGVGYIDLALHNGPSNLGLQAQISYVDVAAKTVRYAYKTGQTTDPTAFANTAVSSKHTFGQTQLSFDADDTPIVTYYDATAGHTYTATRSSTSGTFARALGPLSSGLFSVAMNSRTSEVTFANENRTRTSVAASVLETGYTDV